MSTDSTSAPAAKPQLQYIDAAGLPVAGPADAEGVRLTAHDGGASLAFGTGVPWPHTRMLAAYGAMALARETLKRNPHGPATALVARVAAITDEPTRWGDEKPAKQSPAERKALRDSAALDELVDVVRTVKTRLSLGFDEAKFRQRCTTEEGFMRKAKAVADVKAELARRAEGANAGASSVGVEAL